MAYLNGDSALVRDSGGRTPNYNADAVFRSLLVEGSTHKVYDGLHQDDAIHSAATFPFLAPPRDLGQAKQNPNNPQNNNPKNKLRSTTMGKTAIENLDHLIEKETDRWAAFELALTRNRFLGDFGTLDKIISNTEMERPISGSDFLLRAKVRLAVHRFEDALRDVETATELGENEQATFAVFSSIKVAQGMAHEVIARLEKEASLHPSYASCLALANAFAEVGRFGEADHFYKKSLSELKTTSPFPYAWVYFARGVMWAENAGDENTGAEMYKRTLEILPEFISANIHLAEIEMGRGEAHLAKSRLERMIKTSEDPEVMELYGMLQMRFDNSAEGNRLIQQAQNYYEELLVKYPLAFADHVGEFYLRTGINAERALNLAEINLENRGTERAYLLAIRAAKAANREDKVQQLIADAQTNLGKGFVFNERQ